MMKPKSFYSFDSERFKPAVAAFLNNNCDFQQVPQALKRQMRVYMHDNIPHIWLCDGYMFMEAHFTKEAINEFRKTYSTTMFSALREKILILTRWKLVMKQEDSRQSYTSYQNLSVQLVVEKFTPWLIENPHRKQVREATCLFRDAEIQGMLRNKRHEIIQNSILPKLLTFRPDSMMPSAKDIFASESQHQFKTLIEAEDELMLEEDDEQKDMIQKRETMNKGFKEQNMMIISEISTQLSQNEVFRSQDNTLSQSGENEDFQEFSEIFNQKVSNVTLIDTFKETPDHQVHYYDVKRLLIQEKGEEGYEYLFNLKHSQLQIILENEFTRLDIVHKIEHSYEDKEKSRLEFQKHLQIQKQKQQQDQLERKNNNRKRVTRYRIQLSAPEIKERVLRFMTTFNPSSSEEGVLQMRDEQTEEPRYRAYSQENADRIDQSELLLETKTIASHIGGGYALSQFVCARRSMLHGGEDETESEHDEDMDDPILMEQRGRLKKAMAQVDLKFSMYQRYIKWYSQNEVMKQGRYEQMIDSIRIQAEQQAARELEEERQRILQEEIAREREQKRLAAEQYRREQIELERQQKVEMRLHKQQLALEERQRKLLQVEEVESERQRQLAQEDERRQREESQWEDQERERLLKEQEAQRELEEQRVKIEMRMKLEQELIEKKRQEEQRLIEERRLQEQRRIEEQKAEDDLAEREEQEALEARRRLLQKQKDQLKQEMLEAKRKDEERRERRRLAEIAANEAREREREELLLKEQEKQRLIEEEKARAKEAELKRERLRIQQEQERQARIEAEQLQRMRQLEIQRAQEAAELEAKKQAIIAQELLNEMEEDRSSCSSGQQNERTPAFEHAPSDADELIEHEQTANLQYLSSGQKDSQSLYEKESHGSPNISLTQLVEVRSQESDEEESKGSMRKRDRKVISKSQRRQIQSDSEQSESEQSENSRSASSERSSSEQESDDSEEESDVDSSSSEIDPEMFMQFYKMMSKSKKSKSSKKDKKKDGKKSKMSKKILATMMKAFTSSSKSGKKSSSSSKKHGRSSSEKKKKRDEKHKRIPKPFSLDYQQQAQQNVSPSKTYPKTEIQPIRVEQAFTAKPMAHAPVLGIAKKIDSSSISSFDSWHKQNVAPVNSENIPSNGQRPLQQTTPRANQKDVDDDAQVSKDIKQLEYLAQLGPNKRMRNK